jgi:hypothetical protein
VQAIQQFEAGQNFINLSMQAQVDIEFEQLVKLVKQLSEAQWTKLKKEVEEKASNPEQNSELLSLLLSAPTFSKKQLDEIAKTRKAINQWRTK